MFDEPMFDDLAVMVAVRPGWSVAGEVATFAWAGTAYAVRVRVAQMTQRHYHRFHVATIGPTGTAGRTHWAGTPAEAVRLAEAAVRSRMALEAAQR